MRYLDYDVIVAILLVVLLVVLLVIAWVGFNVKRRIPQKIRENVSSSPSIGNFKEEFLDDAVVVVRRKVETTEALQPQTEPSTAKQKSLAVLHVMAKEKTVFAGYELLQALLAAGLRFGEMNIFHRYREPNAQQDILFSLASATEPGTFDILNMGAFSCAGLTLFLQESGNVEDDEVRYDLMLETAQQLSEELDGVLLDASRKPLKKAINSTTSAPDRDEFV